MFCQGLSRSTYSWFAALIFRNVVDVDVLLVYVGISDQSSVILPYLSLEAELTVAHGTNKGLLPFARPFLSIEFSESFVLDLFSVNNLTRFKVFENLVLDLEEMHCEFLVQRVLELLRHEHEEIKDVLLVEGAQ